jgi:hypothetical protein
MWRLGDSTVTGTAHMQGEPVVATEAESSQGEAGFRRTQRGPVWVHLLPGLACARWGEGLDHPRKRAHPVALAPTKIGIGGLAR